MKNYMDFLERKKLMDVSSGIGATPTINQMLFPFQAAVVEWALKRGKAAIWADCGLGKTIMQLEWAKHVAEAENKPVLILAPIAVAQQTVREGNLFGIEVTYARSQVSANNKIVITNYEMLDKFDASKFVGVVLDESSILKDYAGKFRNQIIDTFARTPFRLACTATPSPNDYMELGNHSEFCGVMTRPEMLATFFVHDGGDTSSWRLKRHAEDDFWRWLASWAVMFRKPSDIGFSDVGYDLPDLEFKRHVIDDATPTPGFLISMPAVSLDEQRKVKRDSIEQRSRLAVEIALSTFSPTVVWCELNDESKLISQMIGCPEITGSDSLEEKEKKLLAFSDGTEKIIVTKPSIAGFGMNWQHCSRQIFCNLTHSYEAFYQAIRRSWRFGQKNKVIVDQIMIRAEMPILENMMRKQVESDRMAEAMERHMQNSMLLNVGKTIRTTMDYKNEKIKLPNFIEVKYELC